MSIGDKDVRVIIEGRAGLLHKQAASGKVDLVIDIQARMREGKDAGYAQWAKIYNLKQMAALHCLKWMLFGGSMAS